VITSLLSLIFSFSLSGEIETKGTISDGQVINIPLNELRGRLNELDKNSQYVLVCQSGQRAYYAYRILKQNGFDHISNLSGAFITHGHISRRASAQN
jgi:rhodanese-related sulfurtransferase